MRLLYLSYATEVADLAQAVRESPRENLAQAVREIGDANLQQPVGDLGGENLPQAVAEIPWGHNIVLVEKLMSPLQRLWYARQSVAHGWSRAVLVHQIESGAYARQGKALSNFPKTLPAAQSDLARQLIKDPYDLDFLGLGADITERRLEQALTERIRDFLVELGTGFAFVGSQYHLEVAGRDYYLDLLFYHLRLGCYVVIDLKIEDFKPEFAGKMNFYLSAVDDQLAHPGANPAIGLILCKDRNRLIVEYALRDTAKPMGVARYRLLPANLKRSLPSPREFKELLHVQARRGPENPPPTPGHPPTPPPQGAGRTPRSAPERPSSRSRNAQSPRSARAK